MISIWSIAAIILSYFIGNISPAILISRMMGIDIRKEGSGNAGTTNVLRVLGKKAAAATLAIDICKGVVAVLIGQYAGGLEISLACGMAVFLGHIWPLAFGFRGGKGIATGFGIALALNPLFGLTELAVAMVFFITTKRVSVGSIVAAIMFPIAGYLFNPKFLLFGIAMAAIVLFKHRKNIIRLIHGQEPKVSFKKQEEKK